jgi:hypothetical protein
MRRQRLAARWLVAPRLGAHWARLLVIGLLAARLAFRHAFFELSEQQFELLDLAIDLLGGATEARPSQHRQLRLEVFDL